MPLDWKDARDAALWVYKRYSNAEKMAEAVKALEEVETYEEAMAPLFELNSFIFSEIQAGHIELAKQHAGLSEGQKEIDSKVVWIRRFLEEGAEETTALDEAERELILLAYLEAVVRDNERIDIRGISSGEGEGQKIVYFPIEEMYTPLKTQTVERGEADDETVARQMGERVPLTDLLSRHRRLLLVGAPGGGKTTFLRLISCVLAKDTIHGRTKGFQPGRGVHLGLPQDEAHPAPIPILLRLSIIAKKLSEPGAPEPVSGGTWQLLPWAIRRIYDAKTAGVLIGLLNQGRCALLLDGLDEVVDDEVRSRVISMVDAAIGRWGSLDAKQGNLTVVSSRPFGYKAVAALDRVETAFIDEFGVDEIRRFLDHWGRAMYPDDGDPRRSEYQDELDKAIIAIPEVRRLASNPVMLTCMAVVHWIEKRLPRGKPALLRAVLKWLVNAKEKEKRIPRGFHAELAHEAFAALALAMTNREGGDGRGKQAVIDIYDAADAIAEVLEREQDITAPLLLRKEGLRFLKAEALDSGVVDILEGGEVRFWHLTFQEHYAARALAEMDPDEWWQVLQQHIGDDQWLEVWDHFAGSLHHQSRKRVTELVGRLLDEAREHDLTATARVVGLLGRLLRILEVYNYRPQQKLGWDETRERVEAIFCPEGSVQVSPKDRVAAAEALAVAGDRRFDPGCRHLPADDAFGFIEIPAGVLQMGNDRRHDEMAFDGEVPRHAVELPRFWMARFPTTVAQFRAFVEDAGFEVGDRDCLQGPATAPVIWVSRKEAAAYCLWLYDRLREAAPQRLSVVTDPVAREFWEALKDGSVAVGLPSEAEWERAARGDTAQRYPWGDDPDPDRMNFRDTGIQRPSPVGCFPRGASPYGVQDLSGNVWEWTRSRWIEYPETDLKGLKFGEIAEKGGRGVVLRGGSFVSVDGFVRAAIRFHSRSDDRAAFVGFRVCASPLFVQI